jgi:hypothetical protein
MTLNDIRQEIAALGFENGIEDEISFLCAVRRALTTIYNDKKICRTLKIMQRPLYPTKHIEKIEHKGDEKIKIIPVGMSYSFKVSGNGSFTVLIDGLKDTYTFNSYYSEFSGIIIGESYIEFEGDCDYTVYDLCFFDATYDAPIFKNEKEYVISQTVDDFLGFEGLPTDSDGKEIPGVRINGESMFVPYFYTGEINLSYRQAPPRISLEEADDKIPLPKDVEHLVALLAASYVWFDDDPERSMHYLALYREGMATAKLYGAKTGAPVYEDVLRWA